MCQTNILLQLSFRKMFDQIYQVCARVLRIGRRMAGLKKMEGKRRQLGMYRLIGPDDPVEDRLQDGYEYDEYNGALDEKWVSLINDSGDFTALGIWTKETLHRTIIEQLIPGGAVLVTQDGELIASTSICCSPQNPYSGVLMYVIVRHDHRGRGLGNAMTQRAIRLCQRNGIKELGLLTDDYRLAAIKVYLRNGFLPMGQKSIESEDQWRKVFEQLK